MREYPEPFADPLLSPEPANPPSDDADKLTEVMDVFHRLFGGEAAAGKDTSTALTGARLVGGFPEPFYRAPSAEGGAEIRFTRDYLNSCLHEAAHWCIAGRERRLQDDYGYWYKPDGRDGSGQSEFFRAEAAPQALERAFALAVGARFRISLDNLGGEVRGAAEFAEALKAKLEGYLAEGFPPRADRFLRGLMAHFHPEVPGDGIGPWLAARMAGYSESSRKDSQNFNTPRHSSPKAPQTSR